MPVVEGRSPSIRLVRDGLHSGACAWAFVKSVPRASSRSMFGVRACGCPPRAPIQSFWSSIAMKRTSGGRSAEDAAAARAARRTALASVTDGV